MQTDRGMETLDLLYAFMDQVTSIRREAVAAYLAGIQTPAHVIALKNALNALVELPPPQGAGDGPDRLIRAGDRTVTVTLDYEFSELGKDIRYLEDGEPALDEYHASKQPGFRDEVSRLVEYLDGEKFGVFLTDRDGTVNNYCGRYRSSHQAVYNAVFLTRFARACADRSVILTSAPLDDGGLLALTAIPEGTVCYAGSAGREYLSETGDRGELPLSSEQRERLRALNSRLAGLLDRPGNRVFAMIGSGVQYKYGQTTVSRQDIHGSIPEETSRDFAEAVGELVRAVDPGGRYFRVSDTGRDVEIILTVGEGREFHKGEGARFLDRELGLNMSENDCLICGDTHSDIAMVEYVVRIAGPERTRVVFVTEDPELRKEVRLLAPAAHFATTPDALVTALNTVARRHSQ